MLQLRLLILFVSFISLAGNLACAAAEPETGSDQLKGTVEIRRQAETSPEASSNSSSGETAQSQEPTPNIEAAAASESTPIQEQTVEPKKVAEPEKSVAFVPAKPVSKSNPFKEANELIKQRKYTEALAVLNTVQPQTELSHYYIALCYQYLNQTAKAKTEYMWVYNNGKNPQLRANAGNAYTQISQYQARRTYAGQGNTFARVNYSYPKAPPRITVSSGPG